MGNNPVTDGAPRPSGRPYGFLVFVSRVPLGPHKMKVMYDVNNNTPTEFRVPTRTKTEDMFGESSEPPKSHSGSSPPCGTASPGSIPIISVGQLQSRLDVLVRGTR